MSDNPQPDDGLVTVSIACESGEAATQLAAALVEGRVAACAQTWPMRSTYRWEDSVERAEEHMLWAKTTQAMLPALEALVRAKHSYDVPEIMATPVTWASADYAQWVRESVGSSGMD
jgi:periplasmic divalent cation tolerance protein